MLWACSRQNRAFLKVSSSEIFVGLRDIALLVHPLGPVEAVFRTGQVGLGQLDFTLDGGVVLHEDALFVFDDRDLGDFAGQLGVLVVGLGLLVVIFWLTS